MKNGSTQGTLLNLFLLISTYSKVRDEGPLLHGLVVCGLTSHQAEVKGQSRVLRTHDHGAKRCGCVDTNVINHILWLKWKMWWSSCFDLSNTPECALTKSPRKRASVRKLTTKRPCSLMRMLVGYREPKKHTDIHMNPFILCTARGKRWSQAILGQHHGQMAGPLQQGSSKFLGPLKSEKIFHGPPQNYKFISIPLNFCTRSMYIVFQSNFFCDK